MKVHRDGGTGREFARTGRGYQRKNAHVAIFAPPPSRYVATPSRTACPLSLILCANGALFAFGILGYLAYLLR
jgi:hypothetical protein